ncbi:hypothetical protein CDO73_04735 [Saccharibacillus sp. O23]|uniref:S-layer homology domain-containing protein n=1 Tax=Saccharibacillus sp. O23 TaxID=2009338 RepID=UPI000B4E0543|nr:S-layer homology domain-containing protein [Saccharibacillus sp. O23]OWR31791.1 hypothetical protein CDO73_04735 [Saccharibacillus sp. O23]
MSPKNKTPRSTRKKSVILRSAILTTGMTAQLFGGAPAVTNADPAAYEGDSYSYLSQYLGISSAYAEPNPNSQNDNSETLGEGGSDHGGTTPPPVNPTPIPDPTPVYTYVPAPVAPENPEDSIQVLAVSAGNLTSRSASLSRSVKPSGAASAELRLTAVGLTQASDQGKKGETLAYRLPQLQGTDLQTVLTGSMLSPLSANANKLSISTSDFGITFPTDRLRLAEAAQKLGTTADQVDIMIQIEKAPVIASADAWAKVPGAAPLGDAYTFRMLASSGTRTTEIAGYDQRYGQQTIPIPQGSDTSKLGAVMLVNGQYVPVPVTFKDGQAVLHTTGGNPVMLVQYDTPNPAGKWFDGALTDSTTKGFLGGASASAPLDRESFARMAVRALGLEDYGTGKVSAVAALRSAGLLDGLPEGAQTDGAISREEMIAILVNASRQFDLPLNAIKPVTGTANDSFSDSADVSDWAGDYVEAAYAAGIFQGDRGKIEAQRTATASEAAAMLVNLLRSTGLSD